MTSRIELSGNSKFMVEMEMACNSNSFVWMAWNLLLESESDIHFQFLFGCANHGIGWFLKFGQYKVVYIYK
jgi:hypothetical protein